METGLLTTDQIRSWVIPLLEKYDMCSASLFGSYARDEADASSDIDILLVAVSYTHLTLPTIRLV